MNNILERLRDQQAAAESGQMSAYLKDIWRCAADEIERLRALSQNNALSWDAIVRERDDLRAALTDMFALIDEGLLVRNIEKDAEPSWAMRQVRFVQRLAKAQAALNPHYRHEDKA